MNILHIHTSMHLGGVESVIRELANEMSKKHTVSVCTIFDPQKESGFEDKLSTSITRYSLGKKKRGFSLIEIFKIFIFIKKHHFDVIHIHGFFYYYALTILLLHKKRNFIYTVHSDAYQECSRWDKRLFFLKKIAFKLKWIYPVTISHASQQSFNSLYHTESALIHNGIKEYSKRTLPNLQKYRYTSNTKIFLHPGRITEAKNQIVLCDVFQKLITEGEDVVLLIAGSRDDENIFYKISTFFSDRIIYLGERSDIRDLLCAADAFCLPSNWEGFPISLLEAISVGCIPICSPVGGIPEVITDKENGFLSYNSSEHAYYLAVRNYLNQTSDTLINIKNECIKTFSKFTIEHTVNKYIRLYREGNNRVIRHSDY